MEMGMIAGERDWKSGSGSYIDSLGRHVLLNELLCVRPPVPVLPDNIVSGIDQVLLQLRLHRILTRCEHLTPLTRIDALRGDTGINIHFWQGDITTLQDVVAVTNAANSQMLGCFQPTHRCIDNTIHKWAGPRLRNECYQISAERGRLLDVGSAVTTKGYCLPSPFVIHTVGPQLGRGTKPSGEDCRLLAQCYVSILDAAEALPHGKDGRKAVSLCGISTGLFGFPVQEAAEIAVETVFSLLQHRETTLTDIIFNTYVADDTKIYHDVGYSHPTQAQRWLRSADAVIVSAGAGLSAADGLDYTSRTLFAERFHGFLKYGLTTLYSVFGFNRWPSEEDRWAYYFHHLNMVKTWPASPIYATLIAWLRKFGSCAHVRTSNADGLFLANGWPENQLSTPQGRYSVLQCLGNCRPDSFAPSAPFLEAALPHLDPDTQRLNDASKVPRCQYCGGRMNICVRAASWFNEGPFAEGERRWRDFLERIKREGKKNVVILELGAGMSTPPVLRWANEDLVEENKPSFRLIRVGLGPESRVPDELEDAGLATYVNGDIAAALMYLFSATDMSEHGATD
ncbi:hypothetical protein F5Y19DRAFT_463555 [Xylariaceae sp. FL1651]|nr:hypothetical protein F5Y19DRAFT_463555 [Xylariaceae sp. FL1651]